jgi:RNA polymerase-binding transcription factor DksA
MADTIDDAQAVNELHQELSLREFRTKLAHAPAEFNGKDCTICGEPVEPARLLLGFWYCIECARLLEHKRRLGIK